MNGHTPKTAGGLGELVRRSRRRHRLTQKDLADCIGVSRGYIAQIEAGIVERPGTEVLGKLAEVLGHTREQLARAAGIIESEHTDDTLAMLRRIHRLPTPEARVAALMQLDDEVSMLLEDLAVDLSYKSERDRLTQLRAQERVRSVRGSR